MIHYLFAKASRSTRVAWIVALLSQLCWPSVPGAQERSAQPSGRYVPTFETLPHASLPPRSTFKIWCGRNDRFLLGVNGALEAYDAGIKSAAIAVSSSWPAQCSEDGQQLVYVDTNMGYVTQVDIASGDTRLIASYDVPKTDWAKISFSHNLKSVATNKPLRLTANAGNVKVIQFDASNNAKALDVVKDIKWSVDSSKLFVAYSRAVEVLDASGRRIGSGTLPKGSYYRHGWFDADQQALIMHLALDSDESEPGIALKCSISDWKCDRIRSRVDSISVGRGIIGTVSPLGKTVIPEGGSTVIYSRYTAELRDPASNLLVRQVLPTAAGRYSFKIHVSPSAKKAILIWSSEPSAECPSQGVQSSRCRQGVMADLSKVIK
jgi:hypothetical protein